MKTNNKNPETPHPEKTGKIPASGVISETYKEEVNPQDELGSSSGHPQDPEESKKSTEDDLNSYPLEEADISEGNIENERFNNGEFDEDDSNSSASDEDEFLK